MKRAEVYPGVWTMQDDRSGFRVLNTQMRRQWDNSWVFEKFWERRQPQDFLRGIPDNMGVPYARPKTQPVFLEINSVKAEDL